MFVYILQLFFLSVLKPLLLSNLMHRTVEQLTFFMLWSSGSLCSEEILETSEICTQLCLY